MNNDELVSELKKIFALKFNIVDSEMTNEQLIDALKIILEMKPCSMEVDNLTSTVSIPMDELVDILNSSIDFRSNNCIGVVENIGLQKETPKIIVPGVSENPVMNLILMLNWKPVGIKLS